MIQIFKLIKKLTGTQEKTIENPDELRRDFKVRYHTFKLLLSSNNRVLEGSAQIEKLLSDAQPFGMSTVKASCMAVLVNVYKMISNLNLLSDGKYLGLIDQYTSIEKQITTILNKTDKPADHRLVIDISDIDMTMSDCVGQKMANLGELKNNLGLSIPQGFVITSTAAGLFFDNNGLYTEINRKFKSIDPKDTEQVYLCSLQVQQLILDAPLPLELETQMKDALVKFTENLDSDVKFALRSSALGEDNVDASFAGLYKTLLNISADSILQAYKEIVASLYSIAAISYRLNKGFRDEDIKMCVGCLAMVDAVSGGVVYTSHPFSIHDNSIHIQSTWGLAKSVVDGLVNNDLFVISRKPELHISHKEIHHKDKKFICNSNEGVFRVDTAEDEHSIASLEEKTALDLAQIAVQIESCYGTPQDIEWALAKDECGGLVILQCRPLKQHASQAFQPKKNLKDKSFLIVKNGVMASPGVSHGQVYIAKKDVDLLRFPEGAVLVIRHALPKWASILTKASAVIVETGGFAGHLANVAREFSIPALFGLKDACTLLIPGKTVTVDADDLSVYSGKIDSLLKNRRPKINPMKESPVYNTLEKISQYITPLNLLDPDSPDFKPSSCTTLHDITRFIHEKSVTEMFDFGKRYGFDEISSKQLYHEVPMQWWVLNLDDGFNKKVIDKYVRLDDIDSIPMLALWEGIIAVPWEGPPPVDRKGMMSVMFQATANPALNTGVKTKYSEPNYFMISKQYCNLSTRLGFHFTTLETHISERIPENYISFRFQGGAADHERRLKRVQFIGNFLAKYDFNIRIKKDHLNARLKGFDQAFMLDRLKIIGYLIIHTRQLDMVTSNPLMIEKYYNKFRQDIESVLGIPMDLGSATLNKESLNL
ncbi:MAG: pyruvate, water dikinase [Desulfobacteraceae bacterium]|nr:pyruvate, water dikinase [Desulfobacteraceae bacterium]